MSEWQPIETAPKDGRDILICLPTGTSDHFYPVHWNSSPDEDDLADGVPLGGAWQCRWAPEMILTEAMIAGCFLAPMWTEFDPPPSSLMYKEQAL